MELAQQQLEYAKKKLEAGTGTQEQFLHASRDLYATQRELAQLAQNKAKLLTIAQDEIQLIEQQLQRTLASIKIGGVSPGSDLELRKELLRLRREVLNLE